MKDIIDLVREFQPVQEQAIKQIRLHFEPEVEQMIRAKEKDMASIERVLDTLLDFAFDASVLTLFKKLCRYYYALNPHATAQYVLAYRDLWDDE